MDDAQDDEAEVMMLGNAEMTEFTIVIRRKKPMTTEDVCVELEFLANEMSRADDQMKKPGTNKH